MSQASVIVATEILQAGAENGWAAEDRFYARYAWCLNPMLSLRDLLQHLGEEIESYQADGEAGWQGEERRINLYLFACAIACTFDDHSPRVRAAWRRWRSGFRRPGWPCNSGKAWTASPRAAAWRRDWTECVDAACELLLDGGKEGFCAAARRLLAAAPGALGEAALGQRMRIPEAFRCQDLTHQDVCRMVDLCLPALAQKDRPIRIIGPRTAGAYFAPLAAARLRALGYAQVAWTTVRPKNGLTRAESRAIRAAIAEHAQVLIIDDHPNSGHTLRLLLGALRELGSASAGTIVALPGHPSIPDFTVADEIARGVRLYLLPPEDRHKARLLDAAENMPNGATAARNQELAAHYADGFQVRLKRVLETGRGRVMAKSVGWGWLGYHAWLAGAALEGFVPRTISLRHGILYAEYAESPAEASAAEQAEACGAYIARRVNTLALGEDPASSSPGYRWCGWDDLAATLSRVYGPYLGPS